MTTETHTHEHPHQHRDEEPGQASTADPHRPAVLDIGGDIGALILYTPKSLAGLEIEVSPIDNPDHRTHTQVLRRTAGDDEIFAGLFLALPAGDYRVWDDDPDRPHRVTIRGGEVAELDWR